MATIVAVAAAVSLTSTRDAIRDQRGFTIPQMGIVGIILLALLSLYFFFRCTAVEAAVGNLTTPLPAGSVQIGAAAPAGTRPPVCETGYVCTAPGRSCLLGTCTVTYEWDSPAAKWRCGCGCR
jgi:hypothetical protein